MVTVQFSCPVPQHRLQLLHPPLQLLHTSWSRITVSIRWPGRILLAVHGSVRTAAAASAVARAHSRA